MDTITLKPAPRKQRLADGSYVYDVVLVRASGAIAMRIACESERQANELLPMLYRVVEITAAE